MSGKSRGVQILEPLCHGDAACFCLFPSASWVQVQIFYLFFISQVCFGSGATFQRPLSNEMWRKNRIPKREGVQPAVPTRLPAAHLNILKPPPHISFLFLKPPLAPSLSLLPSLSHTVEGLGGPPGPLNSCQSIFSRPFFLPLFI